MPNVDWSDVFGPAPDRKPTCNELGEIEDALNYTVPYSTRAAEIQRHLIRTESSFAYRICEQAEEANVISNNAEAILRAIDKMVEQKRAKRLEEERRKRWDWSGVKLDSLTLSSYRERKTYQTHTNKEERPGDILDTALNPTPSRTQSARSRSRTKDKETQPEANSIHSAPVSWRHSAHDCGRVITPRPRAEVTSPSHTRLPASPVPSTSSKYSRSTNGASMPVTTTDNTPLAWAWREGVAKADSARSSRSLGTRRSTSAHLGESSGSGVTVAESSVNEPKPASWKDKGKSRIR